MWRTARFSAERISPQASSLLLASWREKSGRTYDLLFSKWASWCVEWDIDPISGDITGVVNFLADLFHQGYQHRSLCSYRSAISSVHEKVNGQPIGSHPMVSRLLKGAFHERPPQPRSSATWDVSVVTNHIVSLGNNQNLTFADLTLKLVMLLALTRPSRSMDLTNLDIRFRHYSPEGVTFQSAKLAKQSRQTKPVRDFFLPKFEQNKKLCSVLTLLEYEKRTTDKHSPNGSTQLLIAMIRPHKPVSSSTVARWLKTVLVLTPTFSRCTRFKVQPALLHQKWASQPQQSLMLRTGQQKSYFRGFTTSPSTTPPSVMLYYHSCQPLAIKLQKSR